MKIKLSYEEMNGLIRALDAAIDLTYKKKGTITQEVIDHEEADGEIPQGLLGYKVKVGIKGDHKHDGQVVDYTFTFTNPKGVNTVIRTEMALMVGWNFCESEYTIK